MKGKSTVGDKVSGGGGEGRKDGNKSYPSRDKDCPDTSMAGATA